MAEDSTSSAMTAKGAEPESFAPNAEAPGFASFAGYEKRFLEKMANRPKYRQQSESFYVPTDLKSFIERGELIHVVESKFLLVR